MPTKDSLTLPGEIVKKDNRLVRTRVKVDSVDAARVLASLIACIRADDTELKMAYMVDAKHLPVDKSGRGYRRLRELCQELAQSTAEVVDYESGDFMFCPFFSSIIYNKGTVKAKFNYTMKPYLLELKSCFVRYNLLDYLMLPSIYSQRLFEILVSWSSLPEVKISISELGRMLNIPEYMKSDFRQFRVHVLEKAHRDITTKTSFRFDWEPIKAGRCIESIRFLFNGKRKAISKRDKGKAQEERRKRLQAKRYLEAIRCAKEKGGDCQEATNKRLVCKVCLEQGIRHQVAEELQQEGKGRKEPVQCSFFE